MVTTPRIKIKTTSLILHTKLVNSDNNTQLFLRIFFYIQGQSNRTFLRNG